MATLTKCVQNSKVYCSAVASFCLESLLLLLVKHILQTYYKSPGQTLSAVITRHDVEFEPVIRQLYTALLRVGRSAVYLQHGKPS